MTTTPLQTSAAKFDPSRAAEYAVQARIALAGYDACHDLAACLLSVKLGHDKPAHILVGGAGGTAQEVISAARLSSTWYFTAVDPSPSMLDLARGRVIDAGLDARVTFKESVIADLPDEPAFDAALLMGVLHHLPGDGAKRGILGDISRRLKPGGSFILAGNRTAYQSKPLFLAAWGERWRMQGASEDEIKAKLGKILQGADPPSADAHIANLLGEAGFAPPALFFSSLFWGAWITARTN